MELAEFWLIIDAINAESKSSTLYTATVKILSEHTTQSIIDFGAWAWKLERYPNNVLLWATSAVLNQGQDNYETKHSFSSWVTCQGEAFWDQALRAPDDLNIESGEFCLFPNFRLAIAEAYSAVTGSRYQTKDQLEYFEGRVQERQISAIFERVSKALYKHCNKHLPEDDDRDIEFVGADFVKTHLPKLWEQFGDQWQGPSYTILGEQDDEVPDPLEMRIENAIEERVSVPHVVYARTNEEGELLDELEQCAFEGKIVFVKEAYKDNPDSKLYKSNVLENPTWLDIAVAANRMIMRTEDYDHYFLEDIEIVKPGEVTEARFIMGS